jgi:hypothetical protein
MKLYPLHNFMFVNYVLLSINFCIIQICCRLFFVELIIFLLNDQVHNHSVRNKKELYVHSCHTTFGQRNTRFKAASLSNNLQGCQPYETENRKTVVQKAGEIGRNI